MLSSGDYYNNSDSDGQESAQSMTGDAPEVLKQEITEDFQLLQDAPVYEQSSSSNVSRNKKDISKVNLSKKFHVHDKSNISKNGKGPGKKKQRKPISRKKMYSYIYALQNTVKKQKKIIKILQLKLKKLRCDNGKEYTPDGNIVSSKSNNSKRLNVVDLQKRYKCRKIVKNVNDVSYSAVSENIEDSEYGKGQNVSKDTRICNSIKEEHTDNLNSSDNKQTVCVNSSNDRQTGHSNISSGEYMNLGDESIIVENDSRVHLHSDEMKNRNCDEEDLDEEVIKSIKEFMFREDISVLDLGACLKEGEEMTRFFRRHFLSILYKQFHAEVDSRCNFFQFCKHIPENVIKPSPTYWKVLLCSKCENTELKFLEIATKVLKRKDLSLESVLVKQDVYENITKDLGKLKNCQSPFTYTTWAKTLLGKMEANEKIVTTTIGSACTDILKELEMLKEHLIRCFHQYEAVREAREETEISPIHAMVHIDWYESPSCFVARHLHTSYFPGDGFKTLHAGYVRTQKKSFGFASLSDCRDHTAPAVWASINNILVSLAKDGMKVITIVSDPATAQYRNKGNFYLMRRFAKQNNVDMKWIYLEVGHGKGIADSIGASIKQIMCDTIVRHPNKSLRSTMDILPIIKELTPIKLFSHSEQLVQQYKNLLSRQHLVAIPRTCKIHEVCVKETSFYVKESSADTLPFFSLESHSKGTT